MTERSYFVYVHRRLDTGEVFYVGKGTRTNLKQYIRANTTVRRNIFWRRIVAKAGGFKSEVLADFFDERDAFSCECELIALYGKQANGGVLCNLTDGGEGHAGLSPSLETRRKMSDKARGIPKPEHVKRAVSLAQRGVPNPPEQSSAHSIRMRGENHPKWGKKDSPETCAKRAASMKGKLAGDKHPFYGKKRPLEVVAKFSGANGPSARKVIDTLTGHIYGCVKDAAAAVGRSDTVVCRWLNGKRRNLSTLRYA